MTPAARVAAAIEVLDDILSGTVPEKALTGWGRAHRFAGSKDRAAIRDHVFQALRCRASYAWVGGAETGRGIMLGATALDGTQDTIFTGEGHAPEPLGPQDMMRALSEAPRSVRLDMPEWILPQFDDAFADGADDVLATLQSRAGIFLRVNEARISRSDAMQRLADDGISTAPLDNVNTALEVTENERKISQSTTFLEGLVELQDPSSQAAISALSIQPGLRVLDLCAGGGGKALAMAAKGADVTAHDIDPRRMVDIAPRAARAGVNISTITTDALKRSDPFDLVLCDAPCSGSGTWRRTPAAKWALTDDRLTELTGLQDDVLDTGQRLTKPGGTLAYATCSVFANENSDRVNAFIQRSKGFALGNVLKITPNAQADGFFMARLDRAK